VDVDHVLVAEDPACVVEVHGSGGRGGHA
jgi:hypothetical protein